VSQLVAADIIRSKDKLLFIAHSVKASMQHWERKVTLANRDASIQQQPSCLKNGHFLTEFCIQHHRDTPLDVRDPRFWTEHHESNSYEMILTQHHAPQPSQFSERTAEHSNLVPCPKWMINLMDP
jgi:hypothetical protein